MLPVVFVWRRCDILFISGFIADVMFVNNQLGRRRKVERIVKVSHEVAALALKRSRMSTIALFCYRSCVSPSVCPSVCLSVFHTTVLCQNV